MKREINDADHESSRDSVRSSLDRQVKPHWNRYLAAKQFPREMWLALGQQGLFGLEIPEQYGGPAAGVPPPPDTATSMSPRKVSGRSVREGSRSTFLNG
jgi:alkylation response protein AidB-like acyl-CoA dehydrogenase